jgi:hypothetical protein
MQEGLWCLTPFSTSGFNEGGNRIKQKTTDQPPVTDKFEKQTGNIVNFILRRLYRKEYTQNFFLTCDNV